MNRLESISAIVLAAGASRRMGQNKLLLPFRGRPVLLHALELVAALPFGQRILVTTRGTLLNLKPPPGFEVILNDSGEGAASSVRLGVEASVRDYYMFFAGDMPLLGEKTVCSIAEAAEENRIAIPCAENGATGPALFSAVFRGQLLALRGDEGGRKVINANPDLCKSVIVENPAELLDIDDSGDYDEIKKFE